MRILEKYKDVLIVIGITLAVFAGMKYLLPFVTPFFIAYILVRLLNPFVKRLHKKLKIKKEWLAAIVLALVSILILAGVYFLAVQLLAQIKGVVANMDSYQKDFQVVIGDCCSMLERMLGIRAETIEKFIDTNIQMMTDRIQIYIVPDMFNRSFQYLIGIVKVTGLFFAFFVSVILLLKDYDEIHDKLKKYELYRRTATVLNRLWGLGGAYLKAQLSIMCIITVICVAGLWITGYPYFLLVGLIIGISDVLPFIGTGTILVPWAIFCAISGDFVHAAAYATLFFVANTTREFMEPKLIGKKLGVYPIVIALTVYAGICIYGLPGVVLGPLTLLAIVEITKEIHRPSPEQA